jgi:hypothetical protein
MALLRVHHRRDGEGIDRLCLANIDSRGENRAATNSVLTQEGTWATANGIRARSSKPSGNSLAMPWSFLMQTAARLQRRGAAAVQLIRVNTPSDYPACLRAADAAGQSAVGTGLCRRERVIESGTERFD